MTVAIQHKRVRNEPKLRFGSFLVRCVVAHCLVANLAHAQAGDNTKESRDQEARQLFEAGRIAFNDGRFEDALSYFRRAHELSGRAVLLYNVGAAADRLRRNREALDAFEKYLAGVPEAANRREVESRVTLLRAEVEREEQASKAAPTPAEAAASQAQPDSQGLAQAPPGKDESPKKKSVFTTWWFWTITGVVVVGAIAGTAVAVSGKKNTEPLLEGHNGITFTLRGSE